MTCLERSALVSPTSPKNSSRCHHHQCPAFDFYPRLIGTLSYYSPNLQFIICSVLKDYYNTEFPHPFAKSFKRFHLPIRARTTFHTLKPFKYPQTSSKWKEVASTAASPTTKVRLNYLLKCEISRTNCLFTARDCPKKAASTW